MKRNSGFEKFIKGKKKAGTVKEEIRQEKRKIRKELEEKKKERFVFQNPEYKTHQDERRKKTPGIKKATSFKDRNTESDKKFSNHRTQDTRPIKKATSFKDRNAEPDKKFSNYRNQDTRPIRKAEGIKKTTSFKDRKTDPDKKFSNYRNQDTRPVKKADGIKKATSFKDRNTEPDKKFSNYRNQDTRPIKKATSFKDRNAEPEKKFSNYRNQDTRPIKKTTPFKDRNTDPDKKFSNYRNQDTRPIRKAEGIKKVILKSQISSQQPDQQMPLNKYIAHCGICSRRDAAEIVKTGKVKVNGILITEPGHKVTFNDTVIVAGKMVHPVKNLVYILLNKPKDYITTTDDPQNRKTVLDLIKQATQERVYPVGRLDRNTSGVLLLTNDGDLSQKLTHPSNEIKKIYAVTLDKPLEKKHFEQILKGVMLDDGMAYVDVLAYADAKDKTLIGVEIHTGRNRIVRRIFESLGYDIKNLDRVMFAGLTKKNVERGKWRFLNEKEVRELKYFKKGK